MSTKRQPTNLQRDLEPGEKTEAKELNGRPRYWKWARGLALLSVWAALGMGGLACSSLNQLGGPPPTETPAPLPPVILLASQVVTYADGMVGVYVPAGEFLMGATAEEVNQLIQGERYLTFTTFANEVPQHTVYLDAYWMDQTEVTNRMFAEFVKAQNYRTTAENLGGAYTLDTAHIIVNWTWVSGAKWQQPRGPASNLNGMDNYPVVQVSWEDALAYCSWAGRQLPTEAQWEKAARGEDGRQYPWGNGPVAGNLLNFADRKLVVLGGDKKIDDGYQFTAPAGNYPAGASPYGALDMAGNVGEWVSDWYSEAYYASSPDRNPAGPPSGHGRVMRGGAWDEQARFVRVAFRNGVYPEYVYDKFGFRCAYAPPPTLPTATPLGAIAVSTTLGIGSAQISPQDGRVQMYVPAGEFLMGSEASDSQAIKNEEPQHTVYLDAFWIDQTEVTQGMYAKCNAAGCAQPACAHGGDNYPVICVDWNSALAYCAWAGRRLPTEAEWEKAARGEDGRVYPWGNNPANHTLANVEGYGGGTVAVGSYLAGASPYGALDMAGNVLEWVNDWYSATYYASAPDRNPTGPTAGEKRVLRGGAWYFNSQVVRAASRDGGDPASAYDGFDVGFRCGATP